MPGITGAGRSYSVATTTAAATAPRLHKQGYAMGSVVNPTSVSHAITWYGVFSSTRTTAYAAVDQDSVAVTQTVAANRYAELPSALAGVPIICPVTAAAASSVSLHFTFYR